MARELVPDIVTRCPRCEGEVEVDLIALVDAELTRLFSTYHRITEVRALNMLPEAFSLAKPLIWARMEALGWVRKAMRDGTRVIPGYVREPAVPAERDAE